MTHFVPIYINVSQERREGSLSSVLDPMTVMKTHYRTTMKGVLHSPLVTTGPLEGWKALRGVSWIG
jgi:hypothetical protein